jgi:hypothetical protein
MTMTLIRLLSYTLVLLMLGGLAANGKALAVAQPQMVSAFRAGSLPLADPLAAQWDTAPVLIVPLVPQAAIVPSLPGATIPSLTAQSLNDGQNIAFRLTWNDDTPDWHATLTNEFRDAAAIQLPVGDALPAACMGAAGQMVNLWHWKADWQSDIDNGFRDVVDAYPNFWLDYYPFVLGEPPYTLPTSFSSAQAQKYLVGWTAGNPLSQPARMTPVENLNALGYGTTYSKASQGVLGRGEWKDGKWYVVFSRTLKSGDVHDAQFTPGQTATVAFAVWDGADRQVGGRKQLSSWTTILIESDQPVAPAGPTLFGLSLPAAATLFISAALLLGGVFWFARRRKRPLVTPEF